MLTTFSGLLETSEAASYCRLSRTYLEKLRGTGGGPRFIKLGRRVRYRLADLEDWIESGIRMSTSGFSEQSQLM